MRVVKWGRVGTVIGALIPIAFLAVFFLLPVSAMVARGLHADGQWSLGAVTEVLGRPRTRRVVWFTLWSSGLATAITVVVGLPIAYVTYRLKLPLATLVRGLLVMPFVLPTVVVGVAFRTLLAPGGPLAFLGWDGSRQAIVAALVFFNLAVVVRSVGSRWAALDSRQEEVAATLGASPFAVFRTVTLPALGPAILSSASVIFLFCAGSFGVVLTLGGLRYSSVETEIYLLTTNFLDLRAAAALSLVQAVAVISLLLITEWATHRAGSVRLRSGIGGRRRIRRSDTPHLVVTALALAFVVTPIGSLVWRSLRVGDAWSLANYRNLMHVSGDDPVLQVTVLQALVTSLRAAVDATLIAVVLGLMVAVVVTRRPRTRSGRRALSVLDAVFMLPLGISAVTVGFGFLIALDKPPVDFRDSPWLVPVAQALVALPLVVRTIGPALRSVDPRQREAASMLGAAPWRVWWDIDRRVLWRPLLAAIGFAYAVALGEFGATSFLARPDHPTLPVVIYQLVGHPGARYFGMALAASVVLAAVTAAVMTVVEQLKVDSTGAF
ncbi:ABC transporter permease [Calidifontibacter terrae]